MTRKLGLARLAGYEKPLRPKERVNKRLDVHREADIIADTFSAFSEEQANWNRRVNETDVAGRAKEREKRRRESERLKAVRAKEQESQQRVEASKAKRKKGGRASKEVPPSTWL